MSIKHLTAVWITTFAVVALGTATLMFGRSRFPDYINTALPIANSAIQNASTGEPKHRNLQFQPEVLAVARRVKTASDITPPQGPQPATLLVDQPTAQTTPGDAELVTLRPSGFDPAEISRPSGRFLFGINNRTSFSDLTFQLIDRTGVVVAEHRMVRVRVWRKVINPPPGRYLVRVVGRADWRCAVTISPK